MIRLCWQRRSQLDAIDSVPCLSTFLSYHCVQLVNDDPDLVRK